MGYLAVREVQQGDLCLKQMCQLLGNQCSRYHRRSKAVDEVMPF